MFDIEPGLATFATLINKRYMIKFAKIIGETGPSNCTTLISETGLVNFATLISETGPVFANQGIRHPGNMHPRNRPQAPSDGRGI